jgi:hypothetical protein
LSENCEFLSFLWILKENRSFCGFWRKFVNFERKLWSLKENCGVWVQIVNFERKMWIFKEKCGFWKKNVNFERKMREFASFFAKKYVQGGSKTKIPIFCFPKFFPFFEPPPNTPQLLTNNFKLFIFGTRSFHKKCPLII